MRRFLWLMLVLFATPIVLLAQEECQKLTHEALEAYGCLDSMKNYPAQLQAQLGAQVGHDTSMSESEKARFSETIMKNISADQLIKMVEATMSANCKPAELKKVLAEIKTPLVQKMRAFEDAPNTPAGAEKLRTYMESAAAKNVTPERKKLIDEMLAASNSTEALVDVIVETSRGMLEGMGAPAASPEQVTEMRKRVSANAGQQMKDTMLAVYRDASDAELEKYIAIQNEPAFRDFNLSFRKALANGMGAEARTTGIALKALLEQITAERKKAEEQKPAPAAVPAAPSTATPAPSPTTPK